MIIVATSGGKSSAWCAAWAVQQYGRENVTLYFNDTGWEHQDLHRFLEDISGYVGVPITNDSDGRDCEDLFHDNSALGSNRWPSCSRILKAQRLQSYFEDGDTLLFGIGFEETERADRIRTVYNDVSRRSKKRVFLKFPLIDECVSSWHVGEWLKSTGIVEPELYRMGFDHNNCSGGCVRQGKRAWKRLFDNLPKVYAERERESKKI